MLAPGSSAATERYVAPNGDAAWSDCVSTATPCALSTANREAAPGDVVNLLAGEYQGRIDPQRSGEADNPVVFRRHPQAAAWAVIVRGQYVAGDCRYRSGACLGVSHVHIEGLYFEMTQYGRWVEILDSADDNVITGCKFYRAGVYTGFLINAGASNAKILDSLFPDAPHQGGDCWADHCEQLPYSNEGCGDSIDSSNCSTCCWRETDPADMIRTSGRGTVIAGNTIGNSSHQGISAGGANGVIRGNLVRNRYHSALSSDGERCLIEGNIILDAGSEHLANPSYRDRYTRNGGGLYIYGVGSIVRHNVVVNSDYGYHFGGKSTAAAYDQRVYHNTFYNNSAQISFTANNSSLYARNELKNNLFHNDSGVVYSLTGGSCYTVPGVPVMVINCADSPVTEITNRFVNNAFTPGDETFYFKDNRSEGKSLQQVIDQYPDEWDASNFVSLPGFVDPAGGRFEPGEGADVLDRAQFLTTVLSVAGDVLQVADASYFFDGWGLPGEPGDAIVNQHSAAARIVEVDYHHDEINVTDASLFAAGDQITTIRFSGRAPDVGALERDDDQPPSDVGVDDVGGADAARPDSALPDAAAAEDSAVAMDGGAAHDRRAAADAAAAEDGAVARDGGAGQDRSAAADASGAPADAWSDDTGNDDAIGSELITAGCDCAQGLRQWSLPALLALLGPWLLRRRAARSAPR